MNRLFLIPGVMLLGLAVGCNESPRDGITPPPTNIPGAPANASGNQAADTFTLKAPVLSTRIKQGDRQTVKVEIDRGSNFKQAVTLSAEAPKGLTVELDPKQARGTEDQTVMVTVSVNKDATAGDHTVRVTGTPETGNATSVEFKVVVEDKKD